jgi:hypothetical protein
VVFTQKIFVKPHIIFVLYLIFNQMYFYGTKFVSSKETSFYITTLVEIRGRNTVWHMTEGSEENHESPRSGYALFATEIRTIPFYITGKSRSSCAILGGISDLSWSRKSVTRHLSLMLSTPLFKEDTGFTDKQRKILWKV